MTELQNIGTSRTQRIVIGVALALGVAVRLRAYLANRSLWLDESMLALNIIERDFSGLVLPLDLNQVAPVGFLLVERLMVVLFGSSEYALRAFPLVAGIAALFVFWRLASTLLLPAGVMVGVAVFAVSERLAYYATEVKQYGVDAAVTVVLWASLLALEPGLRRNHPSAWAAAAVIGALAIWVSHPAVFILGGIGLRWLWHTLRAFTWRSVVVRGPVGLIWAGSFAVQYFVALRKVSESTRMHEAWQHAAAPLVPVSGDLMWYYGWAYTLSALPLGASMSKLVALAGVAGVAVLWYRRRDQFWWAAGALALAWLASVLGNYPLTLRLWLFFAPIMILIVAAAIDEVWRRTRSRLPLLAPALAVLLLAYPALTSARLIVRPLEREEIRPLLHHIRERHRDGDRLYLHPAARHPAEYYAARGLDFPGEVIVAPSVREGLSEYERDVERLRGTGRTWVLFSHARRRGVDEDALMLQVLDRMGVRLEERGETGASVYLYDL